MTPHLWRIFLWQVLRDVKRHPLLASLNELSVGLGIAVYLAIQIANHGANQSFAATVDLVAGKAQLEVRGNVDETLWPKLAHAPGVAAATGIVEGVVTLPDLPGEYLRILGVDLFSGKDFRTVSPNEKSENWDLNSWLGKPGVIALDADFARTHHLKAGDSLRALVNGEIKPLTIMTLVDTSDAPAGGGQRLAMIDIGWAQELFGRPNKLSSIQLLLEHPDHAAAVAASLDALLPPDLHAEPPRQRSFQLQHMVSAFELNLTALSLVSLLVGVFLIYNTISAAVTRRRREIGILRSLGATRLEIRALFLGEAWIFGAAGIVLGCVAGVALAQSLAGTVARTITSLYVLLSIDHAWPTPLQLVTAAVFGSFAVLTGAWLPASEAARVDPVAALSFGPEPERTGDHSARLALWAVVCLALTGIAVLISLHGGPAVSGFAAALFVLLAAALLSPGTIRTFGRIIAARSEAGVTWRMAADNLRRSVHRNAMTVAALAAAVAMLTSLTVMIFSFRECVSAWIGRGIVADLFIAPASNEEIGLGDIVPPAAVAWLEARPEVSGVDAIREDSVRIRERDGSLGPADLIVVRGVFRHNLQFRGGNGEAKAARVFGGDEVAVTESFARRYGANEGDQVTITTPRGPHPFTIAGVYADYSRDQGAILIERNNFDRFWSEPGAQSLAVFLRPGQAWQPIADAFREQFGRQGEFSIYSNRSLRERILTIFDQTFEVTSVLRTVAVIVAVTGVYLAVLTLVTEREREIAALRAIGASTWQIQRLFMTESGMIGIIAAILGMAAGTALALILTMVVNPAFFGWTIPLRFPWLTFATTPLWVTAAAALAAWRPAWKAARANLAEALRAE